MTAEITLGRTTAPISEKFAARPNAVPSDFVPKSKALEYAALVQERFRTAEVTRYGVRVHGAGDYPSKLRDAAPPVEMLYYQGWWDLVASRSVAVVGTRKPTADGISRTRRLVKELVKDSFTIVSGLATGVDRVAHTTAIEEGSLTIAVIGTPLTFAYPRENAELQRKIASDFLVISQGPVRRWGKQDYRKNRLFFPERNITMSALTEATIIVEAGETSGTLIEARSALHRELFILDNRFRMALKWPQRFADKGAIRVTDYDDIRRHLSTTAH
jgi:DNA processing protein